ncbi:MAG: aminodeoxychorismate synthase component I [Candidatus Tectimicrobiota bacterium]
MRTLIIDHQDSMTFNLAQFLAEINGCEPLVWPHDAVTLEAIRALELDNIVLSPGPGRPERAADFGVSAEVIRQLDIPLLGVCLGHQGIGHVLGAQVCHAPTPMHGRVSQIWHTGEDLFAQLPSPLPVVRYHSLMLHATLPPLLEKQAWTADGVLMGIRHRSRPIWGVQFHPEALATACGKQLLENFTRCTARYASRAQRGCSRSPTRSGPPPVSPSSTRLPAATPLTWTLHSRQLAGPLDPEQVFTSLFGDSPTAFWLDSSQVTPGSARFSFMGDAAGPHAEVLTYQAATRTLMRRCGRTTQVQHESIFAYLRRVLQQRTIDSDTALPFDFPGGYVGYLGYELKQECGGTARHPSPVPDAALVFADRLLAFDHVTGTVWLLALAPAGQAGAAQTWLVYMADRLTRPLPSAPLVCGQASAPVVFHVRHDRAAYLQRIEACLEAIRQGESYELCLTNQITTTARPPLLLLYRLLRRMNPAPCAAFLRLPGVTVLSSSPERLLKLDQQRGLEARPIKGTRPRGSTVAEDQACYDALRTSEKEQAEHLMIVDLLRNDLGRVSEMASVHVPDLMRIESYATVHQMVSTIRGRLKASLSPLEAIRAAFPGGSMTGMPKVRTMAILDDLEDGPRGVYSGALGFIGLNHTLDLSVVIRTIVADATTLSIGCGGAIVALSEPAEEFAESLLKAAAPMRAIAQAVTGNPEAFRIDGLEASTVLAPP